MVLQTCRCTRDLLKIGLVRPKQCYFLDLLNVVMFQLLWKCPYWECSFGLMFIDFTCLCSQVVGAILSDWTLCQWLCHCTVCGPPGSLLVPPPLPRRREQSQFCGCWGLCSVVACQCLHHGLLGEAISASVAAVMLSVGSIGIFCLVRGFGMLVLKRLDFH